MSGSYMGASQFKGFLQHDTEFQMAIALNTGIGSQTGFVTVDEIMDDLRVEFLLKVKYMEWNAKGISNSPGIFQILGCTGCTI